MSFWTKAEEFPPILVRLLARRRHGPPLTDEEISRASGIPIYQVFLISQSLDWKGIDIPTMRAFLQACGLDFEDWRQMDRVKRYGHSRPTWQYLRKSPLWKPYFEPLMNRYLSAQSR